MAIYHPASVPCEHCDGEITVHNEDDGGTVACPKCRAVYSVLLHEICHVQDGRPHHTSFKPVLSRKSPPRVR